MTVDEINIAVTKAVGDTVLDAMLVDFSIHPIPGHGNLVPITDYWNDLNACAKMEDTLYFSGRQKYYKELQRVFSKRSTSGSVVAIEECIRAKACERVEAFLTIKDLWREDLYGNV